MSSIAVNQTLPHCERRGVYPSDIEAIASRAEGVIEGRAVAFGVGDHAGGAEDVVLICESEATGHDVARAEKAIREMVSQSLGVSLSAVLIYRRGTLQQSEPGKLSRSKNRVIYLEQHTGRRVNLATPESRPVPSLSELEEDIAAVVEDVLGKPSGSFAAGEDFFDSGADSLAAAAIEIRLGDTYSVTIPQFAVAMNRSVEDLARLLHSLLGGETGEDGGSLVEAQDPLFTVYDSGHGVTPLYFLPTMWGTPYTYLPIREFLVGRRTTVYALTHPWLLGVQVTNVRQEHQLYAEAIINSCGGKPVMLGGYSRGAHQLEVTAHYLDQAGIKIEKAFFFDFPREPRGLKRIKALPAKFVELVLRGIGLVAREHLFAARLLRWLTRGMPAADLVRLWQCRPKLDRVPTEHEMRQSVRGAMLSLEGHPDELSYAEVVELFVLTIVDNIPPERTSGLRRILSPLRTENRVLHLAAGLRQYGEVHPKLRLDGSAHVISGEAGYCPPRLHRMFGSVHYTEYPIQERGGALVHASTFHEDNIALFFDDLFAEMEEVYARDETALP